MTTKLQTLETNQSPFKQILMFAEKKGNGLKIDPVEAQSHPKYSDKHRILDGVHRWHAYNVKLFLASPKFRYV